MTLSEFNRWLEKMHTCGNHDMTPAFGCRYCLSKRGQKKPYELRQEDFLELLNMLRATADYVIEGPPHLALQHVGNVIREVELWLAK